MTVKETKCAVIAVWALTAVGVSWASQVDVRVRPTDGGPQIFVDGKAVPPRMFWGRSGMGPKEIRADEWRAFDIPCQSPVDTERATVHVRFHLVQGGVTRLRNVRMTKDGREIGTALPQAFDSDERFEAAWNIWHPGNPNFVRTVGDGTCELKFLSPIKGRPVTEYHFYSKYFPMKAGETYVLHVEAQGENGCDKILPNVYAVSPDGKHDSLINGSAVNTLFSTVEKAAAAKVDFVSYGIPADVWKEDGPDFSRFDALTDRIVAANPRALLLPRVSVNAPEWWLRKHPDHRMQFAAEHVTNAQQRAWSRKLRPDMASVSSRLYRADAVKYITAFCRHMMERYPANFAGIHPTGQNTHEWFYFDSWIKMNGFDPQTVQAFRNYLGDPKADVPTVAERSDGSDDHQLMDVRTQAHCLAFNRFQQLEMTDFVAELCRACREATEGKKLVVVFYGYAYEFSAHTYSPANSGHYGLENLIRKAPGAIDVLCSPISYSDRAYCGSVPNMSCGETIMRRGILWLNEDDSRTYLDMRGSAVAQEGELVDRRQSCQILLRNTAVEAVHGFGSWWMDLPGCGWYDSEALWNEQRSLNPLDGLVCRRKVPFTPDVALVMDEESMLHVLPKSHKMNGRLISLSRKTVNRAGVSHGQYMLFDVLEKPLSAKLQIYQSCWNLSDAEVEALLRQKRNGHAWRVWCWAAGAQDENGVENLERMGRLNGFDMARHDFSKDSRTVCRATSVGLKAGLVKGRWYGNGEKLGLAYTVTDAKPDEIWAVYPDGSPAVVVRKTDFGGDIFLGVPDLAQELVRAFADVAGIHAYVRRADVGKVMVQAARGAFGDDRGGFAVLQAMEDVQFDFLLPNSAVVSDAIDGREICRGSAVPLCLRKGDVRVFRWQGL